MTVVLGDGLIRVRADTSGVARDLNGVAGTGSKTGRMFGTAFKLASIAAVGGAALAVGFLKGSLDEAREAQKVGAQTNAVIKSTGGIAGVTAKHVGALATAISNKSGIDDEAIASGQNLLLTFTNVRNGVGKGNKVFDIATQAATDMSVALGTDLRSSALQLGKALNDPTKGVAKLQRAGVTFTDQQKKQIATLQASGDVLGAQKIILAEVNKEFGGSAAAAATAGDKFKVAFGNLQESVGTALLPIVDKVLDGLTKLSVFLTNNIGPGMVALNGYLAPAIAAAGRFFASFSGGGQASGTITLIGTTLRGLLPTISTLGAQFARTFVAIGGFVKSLLPTILGVVTKIVSAVGPGLAKIGGLVANQLLPAFRGLLPILLPVAKFLIQMFGGAVVGLIGGFVQAVSGAINIIAGAFKLVTALVHGDWSAAWSAVVQIVKGAFGLVIGAIRVALFSSLLGLFRSGVILLIGSFGALGPRLLALVRGAFNAVRSVVSSVIGWFGSYVPRVFSLVVAVVRAYLTVYKTIVTAVFRAALAVVRAVLNTLRTVVTTIWRAVVTVVRGYLNAYRTVVAAVFRAVLAVVRTVLSAMRSVVTTVWRAIVTVVRSVLAVYRAIVTAGFRAVLAVVRSVLSSTRSVASTVWRAIATVVRSAVSSVRSAVSAGFSAARSAVSNAMSAARSAVSNAMSAIRGAVSNGVGAVVGLFHALGGRIRGAVGGLAGSLRAAGVNMIQGLMSGIRAMAGAAAAAAAGVVRNAISAAWDAVRPGSPSREFRPIGVNGGEGLAAGLADMQKPVAKQARRLVATAARSARMNLAPPTMSGPRGSLATTRGDSGVAGRRAAQAQNGALDRLITILEHRGLGDGGVRALAAGDLIVRETVDLDRYERQRAFRERATNVGG